MCEYAIFNDKGLPICSYRNELCTLCVMGNGNTYEKAKEEAEKALKRREIQDDRNRQKQVWK